MMLALPLLGKIIRNMNAARFSRTMAGLVDSGTPALTALETARHTLQNSVMREAVSDAAVKVREGSAISTALRGTSVFPPLVVQMVAGGEASGDIGKMFAKSAEYLEDEFSSATDVFFALLAPMIIIFLAGIVLFIIAAIFLPILQLNTLAF
jgi:general secretion pathway protein F